MISYRQTNTIILALFCMYVGIWFLQVGERMAPLGAIRLELIIASVLIVLALAAPPPIDSDIRQKSGIGLPLLLLIVAFVLALVYSHEPKLSWKIFTDRLLKFSVMALFISSFIRSPRDLNLFLMAFILACLYITQESFRAALDGSMVWQNQGVPRLHGDTSLFRHPNSLGGLALGVFPFVWFLFPVTKSIFFRIVLALVSVTAFGCVMYSGSRTAYVGLMFFALFAFYHSRKKGLMIVAGFLVISFALPLVPKAYQKRFDTIFTGREIEGESTKTRKQIIYDAVDVFERFPFGIGVGAFPYVRSQMFGRNQDTHNLYLEIATNLGIQGLLFFFLFIYKMLSILSRTQRSLDQQISRINELFAGERNGPWADEEAGNHMDDLRLMRAACLATGGYIWVRLALGLFGHDLYEIYWWMGLGLAVALFRLNQISSLLTESIESRFRGSQEENLEGTA